MKKLMVFATIVSLMVACRTTRMPIDRTDARSSELRGVWIATVANIDWPTNQNQSIAELKQSYERIIGFYADMNYNSVYVQLRTAGDALYPTDLAPWSRFISGEEGKALSEDIVPWMIETAHNNGMEFHAWLNPYRATTDLDTTVLDSSHLYFTQPDWIVPYGSKYYFNPALPAVQEHLLDVIGEVVQRYDIDGIHFDDYFYPYKVKDAVFDDAEQYAQREVRSLSLDDWRRENVNTFIKACHDTVHTTRPYMEFGISPFGVWRNKKDDPTGSNTRAGQTTYDDLYADTRRWIKDEIIDYIAPQAYWSMKYPPAGHMTLVDWWVDEAGDMPLYMGLGIYKVEANHDSVWYDLGEIPRQIRYGRTAGTDGFISFSAKSLMNKPELAKRLKRVELKEKALTLRQLQWAQSAPNYDAMKTAKDKVKISSNTSRAKSVEVWYLRPKGFLRRAKWISKTYTLKDNSVIADIHPKAKKIAVAVVNATGVKSKLTYKQL